MQFKVVSDYKPTNDQSKAIDKLSSNLKKKEKYHVLLGVTGSGKTFTVANVIEKLQKPTLIISHNKTLASQLYQEFREFFPKNAVSFFVSYYDYYQPEAYIPQTDTYIEKDSAINEYIDKLRLATTANLLTRKDCIVVASVSCIYNIGSPDEYGNFVFEFSKGMKIEREQIIERLIDLQYERSDFGFERSSFRVRGERIDVYPAYKDEGISIEIQDGYIKSIRIINPVTGQEIKNEEFSNNFVLYPAKHFITDPLKNGDKLKEIYSDMTKVHKKFLKDGKHLEAQRIKQKVSYDIDMIKEFGYVKGIENYSRYFDGRKPNEAPYTLLDYFKKSFGNDWILIADESHMTIPQIRGMYNGDVSRKKTLIEYGFRLPAALDNRPLKFDEFIERIPNLVSTSATPADWEINKTRENKNRNENYIVEQLIRPTFIPDPLVFIKSTKNQVQDVIEEIKKETKLKQRTLVTTLTKQTAEDLSEYLKEKGIKVHYLHSDVKTLERSAILDDLRKGNYDVIVGINLLREGLDLPEVALVAILDADKEGFLRSDVTLIQTMGRAARHVNGRVILYADKITGSIKRALSEVKRRRKYQLEYNKKYKLVPSTIKKPIRNKLIEEGSINIIDGLLGKKESTFLKLPDINLNSLTPLDKKKLINKLRQEMKNAASILDFELAIEIRDKIRQIEEEI